MKKFFVITYVLLFLIFSAIFFNRQQLSSENLAQVNNSTVNNGVRTVSTPEPTEIPDLNISVPDRYEIPLRKHVFQTFNNCGSASLSMLLSYYNIDASQQEIGNTLRPYQVPNGDNDDKSVSLKELSRYAEEKYNMVTYNRLGGDLELLKKLISNDIPVVVRTWLEVGDEIGHYRLIRGYDDNQRIIIQDDSYHNKNLQISYSDFEKMWMPFSWEFLIITDSQNEQKAKQILGDLIDERTAWQTVRRRSSENNPAYEHRYAVFNQSRVAYLLGEYQHSINLYEQVATQLPFRMLWYQYEPIQSYLEVGNYQEVFRLTNNILNNHNKAYSELYLIRGEAYERMGDIDNAKGEYAKALQYNKNLLEAQQAVARIQ